MDSPVTDRSTDISQPLENLGPDETLKYNSDYLRGTIDLSLLDRISGGVKFEDNKLMKFHGIYQQDDRDIRDERRRQKLEPAFTFMVRLRLPGGVATAAQWLKIDALARQHGGDMVRLTTRQTFQFHWVVKEDVKPTIQGLHDVLLDTVAACGDDARTVMATANPENSAIHAEIAALSKQLSDHVIPKTRAYHEIWYNEAKIASSEGEEPFYGRQYMPRKFKIGFAVPPSNDIDIYTQDLGFIAITGEAGLEGFNVVIGGGMGRTDNEPDTYPRIGDVIGFIPKDQLIPTADAVLGVQRDYGNRKIRKRARFKYTIDDKGLDFITGEIEARLGSPLQPARPFSFDSNGDLFGWRKADTGLWQLTLFIENGRIRNIGDYRLLDGLRAIASAHDGKFILTPNHNVIITGITDQKRAQIEALLAEHGIPEEGPPSLLRRNAMACVAFPTCPLAMAEAERYLPDLVAKIDPLLDKHGLADKPITIRMTGCPNGCARPYVAEIAFTGRAPGKYNLYLGGGFHGERLNTLYRENIGEAVILETLDGLFGKYASERNAGEHFGDFVMRAGVLA
ncbi:MAG: assimilatory sulfite reductase (NADPH) hemoprotein subunit [Sphingomicrobium sp.]